MTPALCRTLAILAALDGLLGLLLLLWPGLWQEALHPHALGTTFYPLQRTGALWVCRGALAGWAAARRRPDLAAAVAVAWGLDVSGDLLLAWRVSDTGPFTGPAYLVRAALGGAVAAGVWRATRPEHR